MRNATLILPAAGSANNPLTAQLGMVNDCLLPVNGKFVLGWTIDNALERGIKRIVILTNQQSYAPIQKFIKLRYQSLVSLELYSLASQSLAETVREGLARIPPGTTRAYLVFGDTIYLGDFPENGNLLSYRTDYTVSKRWTICETDENGKVKQFYDKEDMPGKNKIVSGFFSIHDVNRLRDALEGKENFYQALAALDMTARNIPEVHDCGHIDNYYKTKNELLCSRFFNNLDYDDEYQTITKRSSRQDELKHQLGWYLALPEKLKVFVPRIVHYSHAPVSYTMEYYGYNTLQEYAIANSLHPDIWRSIIRKLLDIHHCFREFTTERSTESLIAMYENKTEQRIAQLKSTKIRQLIARDRITINGNRYRGFPVIKEKVFKRLRSLNEHNTTSFSVIHGDFCFNNILFDLNSRIVKLLDPRGFFGQASIYGDPCYDMAKLRHSIHGCYEFIINDLFELHEEGEDAFRYHVTSNLAQLVGYFDSMVQKEYNLESIKLIEGLLFISMLPLHSNSERRQVAMYLTGIMTLNDAISGISSQDR